MSTTTYKNVLLVGGAGDLGKHILTALLTDSTFNISVLTRLNSTSSFPSNVKVIKVDYADRNSIKKALTGQDVVISAVGGEGMFAKLDLTLIEVSLETGVKWFIPSLFTGDVTHPLMSSLPFLTSKVEAIELLKKNQSQLSHTFISTGGFLDWGFDNGFLGFDISKQTAVLYDEGKYPFSGTTLPSIGKAVVAVLHHPELTINKHIYIADAIFTQQEALALFEKYTNTKWTLNHANTDDSFKQGQEYLSKGDIMKGVHALLMAVVYREGGASNFQGKTSNKALGLETISLEQLIKEAVERNKANTSH